MLCRTFEDDAQRYEEACQGLGLKLQQRVVTTIGFNPDAVDGPGDDFDVSIAVAEIFETVTLVVEGVNADGREVAALGVAVFNRCERYGDTNELGVIACVE